MAGNYDFTKSNFILMIGGQILFIVIGLMIIFFGSPPISFNHDAVTEMIKKHALNSGIQIKK